MNFHRVLILSSLAMVPACSGEDPEALPEPTAACAASPDCAAAPGTPLCDPGSGVCVALPPGSPIGVKDGSPSSVALVPVFEPDRQREPTDLAFNPERPEELWVVNRRDNSVVIITKPGAPDGSWAHIRDPAAAHFMNRPPAIAFGYAGTFGVCGDNDNGGDYFMGPTLFSSDLSIFAEATPEGLGSHLDMLHSSSFCKGIAHESGNIYWVFNGNDSSLDRYDFARDHGPGKDDHADGEIYRYAAGEVLGIDEAPSHIFYSAEGRQLYVADTGHKRILKLDTTSGEPGRSFGGDEPVVVRRYIDGATLVELVPEGVLEAPSGIEVHEGIVYVSDHATSRLYAFDLAGQLVRTLDTGLAAGSLAGMTFGPDGKLYLVDMLTSRVYRIDPLL